MNTVVTTRAKRFPIRWPFTAQRFSIHASNQNFKVLHLSILDGEFTLHYQTVVREDNSPSIHGAVYDFILLPAGDTVPNKSQHILSQHFPNLTTTVHLFLVNK